MSEARADSSQSGETRPPDPDATGRNEPVAEALARMETSARMHGRNRPWNEGWAHDHRAEEDDQALWLLTMVDLKTLLLTLFVVLVAYAYYEPDRYDGAPGSGPDPEQYRAEETGRPAERPQQAPTQDEAGEPVIDPEPAEKPVEDREADRPEQEPADQETEQLRNALTGMDDQVDLTVVEGQINLRIRDNILFAPGAARLSDAGLTLLDELARRLADQPYPISIEGHTDNIPIRTLRFPSNWELSASRASSVLRYLASRGIAETRMQAVGLADTRPIASNDTAEGRAANRRVELVIQVNEEQAQP
ncbi:MAG: OmpA/MotB family protein [Halothiobacillaceae bacterium]